MRNRLIGLLAVTFLTFSSAANAITYNVHRMIGTGAVTGFIETNGTLGDLVQSDIVNWSLTMTSTNYLGTFTTATPTTSVIGYLNTRYSPVVATATELSFVSNPNLRSFFYFFMNTDNPQWTWCIVSGGTCSAGAAETESISYIDGAILLAGDIDIAGDTVVFASVSAVPVPAALPLFGTGLAIIGFLGWRRKRKSA